MAKAKEFPSNQPFNIVGKKNKTKQNSWWQHAPFNNRGAVGKAK